MWTVEPNQRLWQLIMLLLCLVGGSCDNQDAPRRAAGSATPASPSPVVSSLVGTDQLKAQLDRCVSHQLNGQLPELLVASRDLAEKCRIAAYGSDEPDSDIVLVHMNALDLQCGVLLKLGRNESAVNAALELLELANTGNDSVFVAAACNSLGYAHQALSDLDQAIHWTREEARFTPMHRGTATAWLYRHLASLHAQLGSQDSALHYYRHALHINDPTAAPVNQIEAYVGKGLTHARRAEMDSLADCLLAISSDPTLRTQSFLYRERVELQALHAFLTGEATEALTCLMDADALERTRSTGPQPNSTERLRALLLAATGRPMAAWQQMDSSMSRWERSMGLDQVRRLSRLEADHDHARSVMHMTTELELVRSQRRLVYFIVVGLVILALMVWLLWRSTHRRNQLLETKNAELISTRNSLVASEKERTEAMVRTRIARDIHDELGSELTKLAILNTQLISLSARMPACESLAERVRKQSRRVGSVLKDVVWTADPTLDTLYGLAHHVEQHVRRMLEDTPITPFIRIHVHAEEPIDTQQKHGVFMLLKESVSNVLKHANARTLKVELLTRPGAFEMTIADDGRGRSSSWDQASGNGIRSMHARAAAMGCELRIIADGSGTSIVLQGPLHQPSPTSMP